MDVALLCPLVVGTVSWSAPERMLTVVVKGTFNLAGASPGDTIALIVRGDTGLGGDPGDFTSVPIVIDSTLPATS